MNSEGFVAQAAILGQQHGQLGQVKSGALERLHGIGRSVQSLNIELNHFINILEQGNVPQETATGEMPDVPASLHGALNFIQDQLMAMEKLHQHIRSKF